jgi:hypothetical protein
MTEKKYLRREPDRTLCGTCNTDVSEFVKTVVDIPGALLPCGHRYIPTNLVTTVKLVEATP